MKTKIIITIMFLVGLVGVYAQTEEKKGIEFLDIPFTVAMEKAKQNNKLVFIDCYTGWCGACKAMERNVFTLPEVGEYFNERFICLSIDMEKGEGVKIGEGLGVKVYPTFLFIDSNGKLVHRFVGASLPEDFIQKSKAAFGDKSYGKLKERYDDGNRDAQLIADYAGILNANANESQASEIARDFLSDKTGQDLLSDKNVFDVFYGNTSTMTDLMRYMQQQEDAFVNAYGKDRVTLKLSRIWIDKVLSCVDDSVLNEDKLKNILREMKAEGVKEPSLYESYARLQAEMNAGNWAGFTEYFALILENKNICRDIIGLYERGSKLADNCHDSSLRLRLAGWLGNVLEEYNQNPPDGVYEGTPIVRHQVNYMYNRLIGRLQEVKKEG